MRIDGCGEYKSPREPLSVFLIIILSSHIMVIVIYVNRFCLECCMSHAFKRYKYPLYSGQACVRKTNCNLAAEASATVHNVLQCIQIPQNPVTNVLVLKIESLFVISKYHNESND